MQVVYLVGGWRRFEPAANDTLSPQEQVDLDRLLKIERSEGVDDLVEGWLKSPEPDGIA